METIGIELSRIFVKVIQLGGFTKAAEILRIPKSTVSKAISRLEKETGTKLLIRTTRSHTLTAAGRAYYETCLEPIQILEDAQKSLYGHDSIIAGRVKLTAPEDLGSQVIAPIIGELCRQHPKLFFELHYTDKLVDLVKEGFDLAIRIGQLEESGLKVKHVGEVTLILVTTPSYINDYGPIRHPKELINHNCITIGSSKLNRTWYLKSKKELLEIPVQPKVECNQMTSILQIAKSGAGIALVPLSLSKLELENKKLVRVLPEWSGVGLPVSMLSPISIASTARLKVVSDHISIALKKALEK